MKRLYVWVRMVDGTVSLAGELVTTDPAPSSGRFESEFEYSSEWELGKSSFPLDPESLPLQTPTRRFSAELLYPLLSVFDDALPDDWGRRLLAAALKREGRKSTPPQMLLQMRGGGTGALIFGESAKPPERVTSTQSQALPTLLEAAEKFEAGTLKQDDEFRQLLEGSSRAGGARPKALVHDSDGEWLVKFPSPSRDGPHDVVGLEATCLELARQSGLEVPPSLLKKIGRRRTLMVRRFDITPQDGRLHMVSLRTLCRERPGVYAHSYSDLARIIRKHSAAPEADVSVLFRHMVFNAAVGNVDDHLKNFWMLAKPEGYRLAPAFDLVPNVSGRGEHTLSFRTSFECPTFAELIRIADEWNVGDPEGVIAQVGKAVGRFSATAKRFETRGDGSVGGIAADIRKRLERLAA